MRVPARSLAAFVLAAAFVGAACNGDDGASPTTARSVLATVPRSPAPAITDGPANTDGTATTIRPTGPTPTGPTPTSPVTAPGGTAVLPSVHPLDGLTASELETFKTVLSTDGKLAGTEFPYVALDEPPKDLVLDWKPGAPIPRRVFAVARRAGKTYETVVDLVDRKVVSWTEQPGAQSAYLVSEFASASNARQDPRMVAGFAARKLRPESVVCLIFARGSTSAPQEAGKRIGRVVCYRRGADANYFARPVEGLFASVDLESGAVLSVTDTGVVPNPPGVADKADPRRQRPPLSPVTFAGQGNAKVDGSAIAWAGWTLRWRGDRRAGVEIADVRFDAGGGPRRVMYEGYLADLFVPYQDPDPSWAFRTLLDSAEFGLGTTLSSLNLGIDCPTTATMLDVTIPDDGGSAAVKSQAACLFERPTGDPAWRHDGEQSGDVGPGAPETELVLRWISTIGNYDYIINYVFGADGSMRFHVFAAGIVLQKGVDAHTADQAANTGVDEHGQLVGDGLLAVNHDHYMSFRLDLDVDQTSNEMVRDHIVTEPVTGDPGRTQVWKVQPQVVTDEADAMYTPDPQQPERVLFQSSAANGPVGHHPGYELDFGDAVAVAPGDVSGEPGMRRGGWAEHTLWVTPYSSTERFASGLYVPDGTAPAGLPLWAAQNRSLVDTDLVVWFTVGFHHIVRTEDLPTMPAHEAQFGLRPVDMYPYNPFLDLPH